MYEDTLVVYDQLEEDLKAKVGKFVEVCRRGLNAIANKSKVMVLNGKEGFKYEVYIDRIHLG